MDYPEPHRQKGGKTYYFYAYEAGKRRHLSTGKKLKREAYAYIREYYDKKIKHEYSTQTFREYSSIYYVWDTCPKIARALNEGKPMGTSHASQCRRNLDNYVLQDTIFPELSMMVIKRRDILDLRERLKLPLGNKINTLNKTIGAVKAIMAEAYFREDIQSDPGSRIGPLKEERTRRDVLTPWELKTLFLERPGFWDDQTGFDFFFVLANTGMRSAELRALQWDKWDKEEKVIQIHRSWKGNKAEYLGLPKWDKIRDIPVSDTVAAILNSRPQNGPFLFSHADGSHLGYTWVNKRATASLKRSALPFGERKITSHCFRHTANTYLLAQGVNPVFVQAYLGWAKDSALTRVQEGYTHFLPVHIKDCPETMAAIWE